MEENVAGAVREWWCHVATSYWFIAERNTVTDEILATYPADRVFSERVTFEPLAPPPEAVTAEAKPEQPKEAAPPPEAPPPAAEPAQDAPTEAEGAPAEATPAEAAPQPPEEFVPPPEPQSTAAEPSPEAPAESAAPSGEAPAKEGRRKTTRPQATRPQTNRPLPKNRRPHRRRRPMMARLPEPAGLLLDRKEPVAFRFEGKQYRGYRGDTVASALAANDVRCSRAPSSITDRAASTRSPASTRTRWSRWAPRPTASPTASRWLPIWMSWARTTGDAAARPGWRCSACCTASSPWASTTRRSTSRAGPGRSGPR